MDNLNHIYEQIADVTNFVGFAIILIGALRSLIFYLRHEATKFAGRAMAPGLDAIRCEFGSYLLLGLEFSVAADIIETFLEPSNEALIQLGVLIVIRTVIGVFVGRERAEFRQETATEPAD